MTKRVSHTELTPPILQGIKDSCLYTPAMTGGWRMTDGSEMFASVVFIIVKSGCEEELTIANR